VVLFVNNLHVLSRLLGEPSGPSAALRGSVGHSKADILSRRLVVYIGARVQADGKGYSGRRTVLLWRGFPVGSFPILRIWWPDDAASGPIALGLARGLGARDAALGLGILAAVLRRESSGGWLLAAAGADTADLVLTLTNAWPLGRHTRLVTLAGIALNVMVQLYLAFDRED
jgi:hypothetical protein